CKWKASPSHDGTPSLKVGGNVMKLPRRRFLDLVASAIALPTTFCLAWAETYPSRPIAMMVGFPPGGPTDTLARILGDAMGHSVGQTIVIENVTGASGTIATGRVVHANPDGYTIGIGNWTSHVGLPRSTHSITMYSRTFNRSRCWRPPRCGFSARMRCRRRRHPNLSLG